jgi:hypothetical protein
LIGKEATGLSRLSHAAIALRNVFQGTTSQHHSTCHFYMSNDQYFLFFFLLYSSFVYVWGSLILIVSDIREILPVPPKSKPSSTDPQRAIRASSALTGKLAFDHTIFRFEILKRVWHT